MLRRCLPPILVALVWPARARAENTEPFFYSDDAALAAGSVVATSRDAGAIWYNPAALGGVRQTHIDLSGSAFGVRIRNVPDAFVTKLPGSQSSLALSSSDIFSAPHALGVVRALSDSVTIGFGLFVTLRDLRTSESEITFGQGTSTTGRQRLDMSVDETRYHAGPAIGWEIAPGLRIGAALFATYGKANGFAQYVLDLAATGAGGTANGIVLAQERIAFSYLGAQMHAGVQWDPAPDWTLGLLARSPELLLASSVDGASLQASAAAPPAQPGTVTFALDKPTTSYPAFTMVAPLRGVAGVAHRFAPRSWIDAEVDIQAPYSNQGLEGATVINGRVGGRAQVSDTVGLGGGVFTDRSPAPRLGDTFTDEQIDWYGASAGVELRTPLGLAGRDASNPLVLSTTFALKYAIGIGTFRAADVDATTSTKPPPRQVDVVYHTILPYIGSAVAF